MAELHHWTHSWPNAGGRSHRAEFLGLVTSSALSSLWHWQKPVVWMGVLIVFYKVSVPIFRVHWTWTGWMPKVVFAISSSAIVSWPGNSGSRWPHLTSPHWCKTGMLSVFPLPEPPHKSCTGFWRPHSLQWEMLVRGSHDETSSCVGNCQCRCSWVGMNILARAPLGPHTEPPVYRKCMTSLCRAVFSTAHVPKYALDRCRACDFNYSQSLFLVRCYWLNSKGSIYIKGQILKILGRTLGYVFWNLIEISVMLFTDEKTNRYILEAYNDSSVLWNETQQGGK